MTLLATVCTLFIVLILEITLLNHVTIFLAVCAVICFPVLSEKFLKHVFIYLAVSTVLVFLYIYIIINLVSVCTTLVARSLELRFHVEGFFIFS